jgi:hypothetical protein
MKCKKGELLMSNVMDIILNGLFIIVLIGFLLSQGNGAIVLEQMYAKEIALSIDYAKPVMFITMDMEKGMRLAKRNKVDFEDIVKVEGNVVRVKLSPGGEYFYSFFNDVEVGAYPEKDEDNDYTGRYIFTVGEK